MKSIFHSESLQRTARFAVSLLLLAAVIAAAFPQPASAAVQAATCRATYTVVKGDTTGSIAREYGLRWRDIRVANNMDAGEDIKAGQKLCIPYKNTTDVEDEETATPKGTITAFAAGGRVFVDVSGLDRKSVYYIKLRDAHQSVGGFFKVGTLRVGKGQKVRGIFNIPKELKNVGLISICLKNASTDLLICRNAPNL